MVVALLAAPAAVHWLTRRSLAAWAEHGVWIDPPRYFFWVPTIAAVTILWLAWVLFPAVHRSRRVLRYRSAFVALLLGFALLNLANWCAPGWCERFGFPLPYEWSSDVVVIEDGENVTAGKSAAAAAVDLCVAGLMSWHLVRRYRREGVARVV